MTILTTKVAKLAGILAVGNIGFVSFIYMFRSQEVDKLLKQPYCIEAIKILKEHQGARYLMGEDINTKRILKDSLMYDDNPEKYSLKIPVYGADGNGEFTIAAKCQAENGQRVYGSCFVNQCFLKVSTTTKLEEEGYKNKKLIIYDRSKHGPMEYESSKNS